MHHWRSKTGVTPAHLEEMITAHPDAKGTFIVSFIYYSIMSQVNALAAVCHEHGIPLIVDEAWYSHLAFCEARQACADVRSRHVFGSIRKTSGLGRFLSFASRVNRSTRID